MARVRVGVNGLGTIGKRIAYAVIDSPDMDLVGAVKRTPDYQALIAAARGIPLYAPDTSAAEKFDEAGVKVAGTLDDLLSKIDVIVDATPGGVGASYKPLYEKAGVKAIFQGGEKADVAEVSFSTLCNYEDAIGKNTIRVVSCNTTGLLRLICTLNRAFGVEKVRAVIVRRAADPKEVKKGPINSITLNPPKLPSHHAEDVKSVLPWLDIKTSAVVVPTTLMHVHHVTLYLKDRVDRRDIISALEEAPRIVVISSSKTGIKSTAQLIEAARDQRPRNDIPELVVFEESISVDGREVMLFQAVHQESIVVPENLDAIRAIVGAASREESIKLTDSTLGLGNWLW